MRPSIVLLFVLLLLWALVAPLTSAAADEQVIAADSVRFSVALGYGQVESPIALRDDAEFFLLPQLAWYGERAYFENGLFGYALQESPAHQLDLVLYPNEDGLLFNLSHRLALALGPAQFPVPDRLSVIEAPERRIAAMMGLRFSATTGAYDWTVQAGSDVSGVHNGWELALTLARTHGLTFASWQLGGELGVTLKSAELVDYYYMPQAGEIDPVEGDQYLFEQREWITVGPYHGAHGYRAYAQVQAQYPLSARLAVVGYYRHNWLSDSLTDTPLITTSHYAALFAGLQYQF